MVIKMNWFNADTCLSQLWPVIDIYLPTLDAFIITSILSYSSFLIFSLDILTHLHIFHHSSTDKPDGLSEYSYSVHFSMRFVQKCHGKLREYCNFVHQKVLSLPCLLGPLIIFFMGCLAHAKQHGWVSLW